MSNKIKVGIVGGTGYTGVELLRLLAQHPNAELHAITSRGEAGTAVADMFPNLRGHVSLKFTDPTSSSLKDCDAVFFATPHGVAMKQSQELLAAGVRIIDLAADYRMQDTAAFEKWYGMPHSEPELLKESRENQDGAHCRQPGLLSDRDPARLVAAGRGRLHRPRHADFRRQVRRVRRGAQGRGAYALSRGCG